jgi:Sigma-70 region 2
MNQAASDALEPYRQYLKILAELHLDHRLRGKLDASDVVQQTLLRAYSAFNGLRQQEPEVLAAWLRKILASTLADAVEFRFRDGSSTWFPYNALGNWRYNPSQGLLLKFSGDAVYVVLIRGSNLDRPLSDSTTNLTTSGLQRHRIVWMREMTEEEIRQVGETGPTIDSIEVAEFESHAELKEWLSSNAPAFAR